MFSFKYPGNLTALRSFVGKDIHFKIILFFLMRKVYVSIENSLYKYIKYVKFLNICMCAYLLNLRIVENKNNF